MSGTSKPPVSQLSIPAELKARRPARAWWLLGGVGAMVILLLGFYLQSRRAQETGRAAPGNVAVASANSLLTPEPSSSTGLTPPVENFVLTEDSNVVLIATGYIIPRERIELGPKQAGTIAWMGVKKSDRVRKGEIIARLDPAEYQAKLLEAQGNLALAEAELKNAQASYQRQLALTRKDVGTQQALDDATRAVDVAQAMIVVARGQLTLAETRLQWCQIESPIDGIVLERYADQDELVIPQAFGGPDHPSTLLVALADLNDLRVEVDLNEADTAKVRLHQRCLIRPEAYRDKVYSGEVVQISPEADRNKGTLEVEVQIENPDQFLVPELNARVSFLRE